MDKKNTLKYEAPKQSSSPWASQKPKVLSLALQGGGSHGAFTWGVLDRLLEDQRIGLDGISGASAGAVNAAVLAHGFAVRGRDGAREALKRFWESVSTNARFDFIAADSPGQALASQLMASPTMGAFVLLARLYSPYQLNPFNLNPLRQI